MWSQLRCFLVAGTVSLFVGVLPSTASTIQIYTPPATSPTPGTAPVNSAVNDAARGQISGAILRVSDVATYSTLSTTMNGMVITAHWIDGQSAQCVWGSGITGGCLAAGMFQVTATNDTSFLRTGTFAGTWTLRNLLASSGLDQVTFNGVPGNTAFDRSWGTTYQSNCYLFTGVPCWTGEGTPSTSLGWDAAGTNNNGYGVPGDVTITGKVLYMNQIAVRNAAPVGDLYTSLRITFDNLGLRQNDSAEHNAATWRMDTDNYSTPEPGAALLVGLGIVFIGIFGCRRIRKGAHEHHKHNHLQWPSEVPE